MPKGYFGKILSVDLDQGSTEVISFEDDFYRKYLGGGAFGAYFLLKQTQPDCQGLDPQNVITIAPSVTTGAAVSGVSRCCLSAISPLTGMIADSQSGGSIGPAIKRSGLDAIVIRGRAHKPVYLFIHEAQAEIRDAAQLHGKSVSQVLRLLRQELGSKGLSVAQCGPAGERLVRHACVMVDGHDVFGRTGLGAVFGSKNLRALVVMAVGQGKLDFADPDLLAQLARKAKERLPDAGFPSILHKHGTPGVLSNQANAGNLATRNHARGFHPEHHLLDGSHFQQIVGAGETTCFGCVVRCRKKVRADDPYKLVKELGGPEFETLGLLGSNLEITDAQAVARANQMCGDLGLDTITTGALAAMVFECCEHDLIPIADLDGVKRSFANVNDLFWIIERIGQREGIGNVLAEGFEAFVDHYGESVRPYAICVKNQGLAVHMPQVKPSQALMYAACPIGPDHQSSEHDWLLASNCEDAKSLGIVGKGDAASNNTAKVRMTVYSQIYYSLLDNLSLCQFCWGPGNLFTFRDLEDLLRATCGWQVTLWELMKAAERRLCLQRQLNTLRGFDRSHDVLPERLFQPLPDGPSQGRCVDSARFPEMLSEFYGMLGWDPTSGKPTWSKLVELGLEWAYAEE